jgi:hypothetical protein
VYLPVDLIYEGRTVKYSGSFKAFALSLLITILWSEILLEQESSSLVSVVQTSYVLRYLVWIIYAIISPLIYLTKVFC